MGPRTTSARPFHIEALALHHLARLCAEGKGTDPPGRGRKSREPGGRAEALLELRLLKLLKLLRHELDQLVKLLQVRGQQLDDLLQLLKFLQLHRHQLLQLLQLLRHDLQQGKTCCSGCGAVGGPAIVELSGALKRGWCCGEIPHGLN